VLASVSAAAHSRLGQAAADCYALESATYLVAGLLDRYSAPRLDMECAAVQLLAGDLLWRGAQLAAGACVRVAGGGWWRVAWRVVASERRWRNKAQVDIFFSEKRNGQIAEILSCCFVADWLTG
jgi:hypothetical protein